MQKFIMLAIMLLAVSCSQPSIVETEPVRTTKQALCTGITRTDTVVNVGPTALDKFTWHKVTSSCSSSTKPPVLLLASAACNFGMYDLQDASDPTTGLAGYLAARGYAVYGMSPRPTGIAPGACEGSPPAVDCTPMKNWNLSTYVADAAYVADLAKDDWGKKPVVGGMSLGGIITLAAVNAHPSKFKGAIVWEGGLHSANAQVVAANVANCAADTAADLVGPWYEKKFSEAAYQTHALGNTAWYTMFTTPNPAATGVLTFRISAGSPLGFTYASDDRQWRMVTNGNYYDPAPVWKDLHCSLAGATTFVSNLSAFDKPVLKITAGLGLDGPVHDSVALMTTATVTAIHNADFGHADFHVSPDHGTLVDDPIADWLDANF